MKKLPTLTETQSEQLRGKQIAAVVVEPPLRLVIEFADGGALSVTCCAEGLAMQFSTGRVKRTESLLKRPTQRQLDYLGFIHKYSKRYGRAPSEADIQTHFMVSAPSVNQMMQTLERRGFIIRQPGVPRSARICIDLLEQE